MARASPTISAKAGSLAPLSTLDGFGALHDAPPTALPIEIAKFDKTEIDPTHPPGYYGAGGSPAGAESVASASVRFLHLPAFDGLKVATYQAPIERIIAPFLLALGLLMLAADTVIGLWLKGLLGRRVMAARGAGLAAGIAWACRNQRQDDARRDGNHAWLCAHRRQRCRCDERMRV